ncbi:MAG: trypsin-like peptidase domain-containing protein [Cyclobacteriaceae bacterium]
MKLLQTLVIGFLAGLAGAYTFSRYHQSETSPVNQPEYKVAAYQDSGMFQVSTPATVARASVPGNETDFSEAAARTTPSVVYINSISQTGVSYSYWDLLFGGSGQSQQQTSSGSGVIFTQDGYIVTNNHVVEAAEKVQVLYNKKVYDAEVMGTDPSADLAVLKIKESNLPAITLGSSKDLAVGEWVVAVGNPFSLASTVTAGIVSAKGRKINIVEDKFPIESFIQTDAAINPGNSGGALVNRHGELVGINTAILSRTGSYTGYAFAIPVDIARKIVSDIIKFGVVQKAFFGGNVIDYDAQTATKYSLPLVTEFKGVVLSEIQRNNSPALDAGLKAGDIILRLNETEINSVSAFEEELSYHYPGDKITVAYTRDGKPGTTTLTLVNRKGETTVIKRKIYSDGNVGASLEAVDYGVKAFKIKEGLFRKLGIPENYTIIRINRERITDPQEVVDFFSKYRGPVVLYGINSQRQELPLQFYLQ